MKQRSSFLFALLPCLISLSCGGLDSDSGFKEKPDDDTGFTVFKTEKAAWENRPAGDYHLTLTHKIASKQYATAALVKDGVPVYVETGGVSVASPDNFPFPPPVETILEIYELLEEAFSAGSSVSIKFDAQTHTPKSVWIKNYDGPGLDYTLAVVNFAPESGGEDNKETDMDRETNVVNFDMERFQTEKAAWEAQDITAYRFTTQILLDYPVVPVRITVKGNAEPEIEPVVHDGFMEPDIEMSVLYGKTVSEIYAAIEADIEKEKSAPRDEHHRVEITIRYNAEHHYPEYYSACSYCDDLPEPGGFGGVAITGFERIRAKSYAAGGQTAASPLPRFQGMNEHPRPEERGVL
jgi:hypothetical protein